MIEYKIKNTSDKFDIEKCEQAEAELRKKVDKIDATAIEDSEGLWSTMIEEMGAGICLQRTI